MISNIQAPRDAKDGGKTYSTGVGCVLMTKPCVGSTVKDRDFFP